MGRPLGRIGKMLLIVFKTNKAKWKMMERQVEMENKGSGKSKQMAIINIEYGSA